MFSSQDGVHDKHQALLKDARKFMVLLLPSFLDLKLRLKLVRIAGEEKSQPSGA